MAPGRMVDTDDPLRRDRSGIEKPGRPGRS
jgi:hypothetical protein